METKFDSRNECERILPRKIADHWSTSPRPSLPVLISRIGLADISASQEERSEEWESVSKKRRVRVFTRENDALGRGRIDGSIGAGCTGDIKLNPDTESVTVERRIRKRSLGIDKIVSPAVIRFTTSNKSRSRRGRSPGLILVDLAPALVPRYCRSLPFNEETSTGWTRPRFTFQHVPPLILLFDPSIPSLR